jgi:hypothetical protein
VERGGFSSPLGSLQAAEGGKSSVNLGGNAMALKAKTMQELGPIFWEIVLRDRGKCVYCDLDGSRDIRILGSLVVDHLIPKCANGTQDLENEVLSCPRCNTDKGRYDPSEGAPNPTMKEPLIERAKQYIQTKHSQYLAELYEALNSK